MEKTGLSALPLGGGAGSLTHPASAAAATARTTTRLATGRNNSVRDIGNSWQDSR